MSWVHDPHLHYQQIKISKHPIRVVMLFSDKKEKEFNFDYGVFPSVMYTCVRIENFSKMSAILAEVVKNGLNYGSVECKDFLLIKEVLQSAKDGMMDTSKLLLDVFFSVCADTTLT